MTNSYKEPATTNSAENRLPSLISWVLLLSCILIPAAVIINFNMGSNLFRAEMADHWSGYQAPDPAPAPADAVSPAANLEKAYNEIAGKLNAICVNVAGNKMTAGISERVHGSGIVVAGRYVLTNYHIVKGAADFEITEYSPAASIYPAQIILADKADDLALLEVAGNKSLPSATLGDSDNINIGDMVFSMGNQNEAGNIFTTGVVSDKGRSFAAAGLTYRDMIQTETYVPPGACGGPLADINGSIIGINTTIYVPQGRSAEVGFATPINRVLALLRSASLPEFSGPAAPMAAAYNV